MFEKELFSVLYVFNFYVSTSEIFKNVLAH